VTKGLAAPPTANVLLIWVELCFRLDLHRDGCTLFARVIESEAEPWLYDRVRKLDRAMRQRLRQVEDDG
jgi:hypothetical protein